MPERPHPDLDQVRDALQKRHEDVPEPPQESEPEPEPESEEDDGET